MAGRPQQGLTDQGDILRRLGFAAATRIAGGMEGEVYRLDGGLVAKIWNRSTDVALLRDFYAELGAQNLSFRTPEIVQIATVDGTAVSIERELPGRTLRDSDVSAEAARDMFLLVLQQLAGTHAGPAAERLPVMNEATAFRRGHDGWPQALEALIRRRLDRFADQLAAAVPHFAPKAVNLLDAISRLPERNQVVHGDICPENILIDESGHLVALLDWGFLTASGDSAFDAGTAAGFFNMYGESARADDEALLQALEPLYERDLLLLYRAAYAVIGSNAYSPDGQDGHFQWCVQQLCRDDISDLLARPIRRL